MFARLTRRALLAVPPAALLGCGTARQLAEIDHPQPAAPEPPPSTGGPGHAPDPPGIGAPRRALAATPEPQSIDWYLAQLPQFDSVPKPKHLEIPGGDSTPKWSQVPTQDNVAFITIDDGGMARTAVAQELIREARIPVSLFLNSPAAAANPDYFRRIQQAGNWIHNHTITHRNLKGQPYDFQYQEIHGCSEKLEQLFGSRPYLFRAPFGESDPVTYKAARDCGIQVVFFWTQTVHEGVVRYQTAEKRVRPGDVLLMHFRPALADDLLGALRAIRESGLTPARLEDYLAAPIS